jgi:hypothetical protein
MLSNVGLVGRVGQGRFMGTLFPWVTNPSLQAALNEAARTGLVLGMGAPSGEENWLRGVRQGPLATGVTGATYARSGTRAGLDPANSFGPNVVRREAGRGVRVFGSGTNEARATEDFTVSPWAVSGTTLTPNAIVAPNGTLTADRVQASAGVPRVNLVQQFPAISGGTASKTITVSCWLRSVSGTTVVALKNSHGGVLDNFSDITLTTTWTRYSFVVTNGAGAGTGQQVFGITNNAIGDAFDCYAWGFQAEQSAFATDYIPNASTVASASAGADDLQLADTVLPSTSGPLLYLADLPNQSYQAGTSQRILNGSFSVLINDQTFVSAVNGVGGSASIAGLPTSGARRIAMLYTPGAATRLSVNGSAVNVGTDVGEVYLAAATQIGNRAALDRALSASLGLLAIYRATPSDAQLQAMSAL